MKRFVLFLFAIFVCHFSHAQTETINWYVDGNVYTTTTSESGADIILPATPTKRGYTFQGWRTYTPIEYLESTGTQYIDTNIIPDIDTEIILTQKIIGNIKKQKYLFGLYENTGQFYFYTTNELILQWAWSFQYKNSSVTANTDIQTFDIFSENNISYLKINDQIKDSKTTTTQSTIRTLFLFGANEAGIARLYGNLRVYAFKVKRHSTGALIHDFIPVLDYDGVPCMYDKVEHTFYYNAGTGDFIAGPTTWN